MRWLHLSDLHVGISHQQQSLALQSLVTSIEENAGNDCIDLILLTGDLVYSGKSDEYAKLKTDLLDPLLHLAPVNGAKILAVPGNHDLNCVAALPSPWSSLGPARQAVFFDNTGDGRNVRSPRARGFDAFTDFLRSSGILGLDPSTDASTTVSLELNGTLVDFICVNTAWFSDKDTTDESLAPAPTPAIRAELAKLTETRARFIIGHHPIGWFLHRTQEPMKSLLLHDSIVYLHGHTHRIEVDTTLRGIRSLGFGAGYVAPLDVDASSFYENSYAICALDADLTFHVVFYIWDSQNGHWCLATKLPSEFIDRSSLLEGGYRFDLPKSDSRRSRRTTTGPIAIRRPPTVDQLISFEIPSAETWMMLLTKLSILPPNVDAKTSNGRALPGQIEITFKDVRGTHRIRCIGGPGHILSDREVEAENTRFDTEDFDSATIVSLGQIAQDARMLALQLERKKQMRILSNSEICKEISELVSGPIGEHLDSLDSIDSFAVYMLFSTGVGLLIRDRLKDAWFYLLDPAGHWIDESNEIVRRVREARPELASALYRTTDSRAGGELHLATDRTDFDRPAYLNRCSAEFETLKYAPLAAIGMRFPNAKLTDVYIPAQADVGDHLNVSAAQRQALNDLLDTLQLDDAQRAQLEVQIRDAIGAPSARESGAARSLYQQTSAVLILGDPGSGKTCFANNEILTYCAPPAVASWYGVHTPVYVPLAEAANLLESTKDLVAIAAILAARRGLPLSGTQIKSLLAIGRVAFFFDGLDEVGSGELRGVLVEAIGNLVRDMAPLGNRFALTSRPAAVHFIEIPPGFTTLQLKGLTDGEMRILVGNLIRAEIAPGGTKVRFVDRELEATDEALIDRLLSDCHSNPGLRRIARNPLLLTLLVTIYVNSGPLAAKRHRVYAQAIQTLVSVRNRASGQPVLSEADLRHRLGFAALKLYQSNVADIPTKDEVVSLLRTALEREQRTGDLQSQAEEFIQLVGESTGLLVLHMRPPASGGTRVSFLHHSFLEYYAALGFLETDELANAAPLSAHARWREVITLMAGILSDRADVTPFITEMARNVDEADEVTAERLLFAFDCALECDVPPEHTQLLLIQHARSAMAKGPGLVDSGFRRELGERIGRLLLATGSRHVQTALAEGVLSIHPDVAAAYVELVGIVGHEAPLGDEVRKAFEEVSKSRETLVRIAVFGSLEHAPELRTDAVTIALRQGLKGSAPVKYAALRAIEAAPGLAKDLWGELVTCLDDKQLIVATTAARAILHGGITADIKDREHILEKCLRQWERTASSNDPGRIRLRVNLRDLSSALSASEAPLRILALRLLPWLEKEEGFVHDRLIEALSEERERDERVAALSSLRLCRGALALSTLADVDLVRSLLLSPHRDVRLGAIRALGAYPLDNVVLDSLLENARTSDSAEVREILRAVVDQGSTLPRVRQFVFEQTTDRLSAMAEGRIGNSEQQQMTREFLMACQEIGGEAPAGVASQLYKAAMDYKIPKQLRQHSLRAYSRLVQPSSESALRFLDLLLSNDPVFNAVLGQAVADFVRRCRQKVDYVRAVLPVLARLQGGLVTRWTRAHSDAVVKPRTGSLKGIRTALKETKELLSGYAEFAACKQVAGEDERQTEWKF